MPNILEVKDATIRFGGLTAVDHVSLHHTGQEILSLIGPNGAGKTTFFNLLTGMYMLDEGSITFMGQDISKANPMNGSAPALPALSRTSASSPN